MEHEFLWLEPVCTLTGCPGREERMTWGEERCCEECGKPWVKYQLVKGDE